MKLWLLSPAENLDRENDPWYHNPYDAFHGFVIRAETEEEARSLAFVGDEERMFGNPWINPEYTTCIELLPEGEAGIVLSDYNAG